MKDKQLKIIGHYGVLSQLKHLQTEVFELNEAIIERECLYNSDCSMAQLEAIEKNIAEEIADCYVMIEQLRLYYGISTDKIKEIMTFKIDRQIERIDKEN